MVVHFCICSVVGHWLEIPWVWFCLLFGIYDPDSLVWGDPFYPFLIYGIGAVICAIVLSPLMHFVKKKSKSNWHSFLVFFLLCVGMAMVMEIGMGHVLNMPDAYGNYPLWDNSELPLNIMGQAWLPNDLLLGAVAALYTWFFYPLCEWLMSLPKRKTMNIITVVVAVGFVVLCALEFTEII